MYMCVFMCMCLFLGLQVCGVCLGVQDCVDGFVCVCVCVCVGCGIRFSCVCVCVY